MAYVMVKCAHCEETDVSEHGFSEVGKQRYYCKSCGKTFQLEYTYDGCHPSIRSKVQFKTINGSGTRAIARELEISRNTVTSILRSFEESVWHVNHDYLQKHTDQVIMAEIISATEAEMDEMWSYVQNKGQQCWLWWAIDHNTGEPLAFCFGTRKHKHISELKGLLEDFNITIAYTDGNPAYNKLDCDVVVGKRNTQKIERKHLSLRTWCSRLVRKGIRFSKDLTMHKIVVSLVINHWFFERILV